MNLTLFVVVLITAILLVVIAMSIARAISPRTFNKQKGEAYECGVPTRGKSWMQFRSRCLPVRHLVFDVRRGNPVSLSLGGHRSGCRN